MNEGNFYNNNYYDKQKSLVGFIISILSIVMLFVPFIGIPVAITGIIFSKKDLEKDINNSKAKIGRIISIFSFIGSIIVTILFVVFLISMASNLNSNEENNFENKVNGLEDWFKEQYELSLNDKALTEFTNFCGKKGKKCLGNKTTFKIIGGNDILEASDINTSDVDLVNSYVELKGKGSVCVVLHGIEEIGEVKSSSCKN